MPKRPAEPLTTDEAVGIIRACSRRGSSGIRNAALFSLMYRSGLRLGEALALKPKDIDTTRCQVHVLHGKGDRQRVVSLDAGTCAMLDRWLERRRRHGMTGRHPVFCTLSGGRATGFGDGDRRPGQALNPRYVRFALNRAADKAGVEKRVHPHGLRHTHAAELAAEGVPVHEIRDQLGHASLATTDVYLRRIAPAERLERLRQRVWATPS